uniref:Uncharacterized protein n=1 Tax=Macrostomum lignano TaxID=282301 RepID=A0A1I8F5Q4_9PLAT
EMLQQLKAKSWRTVVSNADRRLLGLARRSSSCWGSVETAPMEAVAAAAVGLSEESDSGEDNSVTRLWRRAFSGLKLAKDKPAEARGRPRHPEMRSLLSAVGEPIASSATPTFARRTKVPMECQGQQDPPGAEQRSRLSSGLPAACSGSGVWAARGTRSFIQSAGSDCGCKKALRKFNSILRLDLYKD